MPYRRDQFSNGNYYHIFNKTIDHKEPFSSLSLCSRFIEAAHYYRSSNLQISLSRVKRLPKNKRRTIESFINQEFNFKVSIIAYCLMPNHFHFVLKQNQENGIEDFIANLINSFTRFFNTINARKGPLFLDQFHAVPIQTNKQLLYTARYVHLNPLEGGVVGSLEQLRKYDWSSYKDYFQVNTPYITQTGALLEFFKRDTSIFREYVESELDPDQTQEYVYETEYARARLMSNKLTTSGVTPEVV